jgi:hypothetical protein
VSYECVIQMNVSSYNRRGLPPRPPQAPTSNFHEGGEGGRTGYSAVLVLCIALSYSTYSSA